MMHGLALRLEGPLQSWGGPAVGDIRPTMEFPSKSGVLGLVAALMGFDRLNVPALSELHARLSVSVRVDRTGTRGMDFHTAQEVPTLERKAPATVVTRRHYLHDASFVAMLHANDPAALTEILAAISAPRFPPYLGRRACVPSEPLLALLADDQRPGTLLIGEHPLDLLAQVKPCGDADKPGGRARTDEHAYLEGDWREGLAPPWQFVRPLILRDELYGNLPRLFQERLVTHVSRPRTQPTKDTVDSWMPR